MVHMAYKITPLVNLWLWTYGTMTSIFLRLLNINKLIHTRELWTIFACKHHLSQFGHLPIIVRKLFLLVFSKKKSQKNSTSGYVVDMASTNGAEKSQFCLGHLEEFCCCWVGSWTLLVCFTSVADKFYSYFNYT